MELMDDGEMSELSRSDSVQTTTTNTIQQKEEIQVVQVGENKEAMEAKR
jgi:hypothetical protein